VARKIKFREYHDGLVDRMMRRILPPRSTVRDLQLDVGRRGAVPVLVPESYVFFRGHFEGMPMLPGIAQLTEIVLPLTRHRHPELGALVSLRRVRWRRPVFPGETVEV